MANGQGIPDWFCVLVATIVFAGIGLAISGAMVMAIKIFQHVGINL